MIVAGYYGFALVIRVTVRAKIQGLGAILDTFGLSVQVYSI